MWIDDPSWLSPFKCWKASVAGYIVMMAGYNAAFLTLAMVATAGLLLIVIAMPETTPSPKGAPS
jgi:hypothetical protein